MLNETVKKEIHDFFRWGIPRTRGSKIIESPHWFQVISPDFSNPSFNEVIYSNIAENQFEEKVLQTIEEYKAINTGFKWCITPYSSPANSKSVLEKYGFKYWKSMMMCQKVTDYTEDNWPAHLRIEKVKPKDLEAFVHIFMKAWQLPPEQTNQFSDQLHFDHENPSCDFDRYLVYVDNNPAGVASLMRNHKYGYLHATAVSPEYRGKGAYRALVNARLIDLKKLGIDYAISGARQKTSAPILAKLGFSKLWDTDMFLKEAE